MIPRQGFIPQTFENCLIAHLREDLSPVKQNKKKHS